MLENIVAGMGMVFRWDNILASLFGVTGGIILGAIPGLSDITAICLLIPFTFYMNPIAAIAMLVGLSKGANFGGSIPAILFNMPGTPQAMITSFDGYPLTKQGKSLKALKMALYASCLADTGSDLVLFFLAAPVAMAALLIGPPEYAMIVLFSLILISVLASVKIAKGMIAMGLGLVLATIGLDPILGSTRFTFGIDELSMGLGIVPVALGLLVVSEIIEQLGQMKLRDREKVSTRSPKDYSNQSQKDSDSNDRNRVTLAEFKRCLSPILSGIGIGSMIGSIPGIGTTIAAYLNYTRVKKSSKNPEIFGKGSLEGVAAAEAGNNGVVGPNLIPLITLGIPGNTAAALILGAFMLHGLNPGPLFMQQHAPMLYGLFTVLIISNVFTFAVGNAFIRLIRRLTDVRKSILYPMLIIFTAVGAYTFRNSSFDIIIMFLLGVFAYFLRRLEIPLPPLLVAFILGSLFEDNLQRSLSISGGSIAIFFTRPISLAFLLAAIFASVFLSRRKR